MSSDHKTATYVGDELSVFALAKNWKQYWASKVRPLLGDRVLEVGAGIGTNTSLLLAGQASWLALEPDPEQCAKIRKQVSDDAVLVHAGTLADIDASQKFDSIIYIDVLEHIEDDRTELARAMTFLNKGGKLIILSPAHQSLFSPFDSAVGHFRRYSKATLRAVVPPTALVEKIFYLDSVGCVASWANAKLMKSSMPSAGQIKLWDGLMVPLSRLLDPLTGYRVGKTIVMVLGRNKGD